VHLGAFLLLRVSPLLDLSGWLSAAVVTAGLSTAIFAALAGRVQTDIKSALSFASLTQVGIIVAEIGCGLRFVALVHILGHACLRTLQFLRAPTLLLDYRTIENAIGASLPRPAGRLSRWVPEATRARFYRLALERGHLDDWLRDGLVAPFIRFFEWCDTAERRWTDFLSGGKSRESAPPLALTGSLEDMA
jgi:NAD(P)H-quinone oxidoreductase subunit 5